MMKNRGRQNRKHNPNTKITLSPPGHAHQKHPKGLCKQSARTCASTRASDESWNDPEGAEEKVEEEAVSTQPK